MNLRVLVAYALALIPLATVTSSARGASIDRPTKPSGDEDTEHVRIGALGGVGFPRALSIEGLIKVERTMGVGFEYGTLPTTTFGQANPVSLRYSSLAADFRLFPLQSSFFIGLRTGRQRVEGSATATVASYGTFTQSATTETWFLNPRLGVLWTGSSGLSVGISAGLQIPLSHKTQKSSNVPAGIDASEATSAVDSFGSSVIPTIDLLQLGLLL